MPAPLPFRRKKRCSPAKAKPTTPREDIESQDPERSNELPDLSALSVSDESLTPSKPEVSVSTSSRKSSRRRGRKKRRASVSSSEDTTTLSPTPSLPVSPTTLIDLAFMQNWPQLVVNVKANRRQARQRDADGLYPLHWAVSGGPPLEVVRALIKAYPGATKKVDAEGSNALHFASHYGGSVAMMELLLATNPKAINIQDNHGRSPLYHAVDKSANIDVLRRLATADPTMITTPCRPQNYQTLEKEGKSWNYLTPLYLSWVIFLTDKRSVETCAGKVWDKACLLLDLVYRHRFNVAEGAEVSVVAAAIALDSSLPQELVAVVINGVSSDDLLKVDPVTGKNPLALAASMTQSSSERSDELIRLLLEACPNAATALDREGKTPLANAAESGRSWGSGLGRLFGACPDALRWSDKTTGLPPCLLLAASSAQAAGRESSGVVLADPYNLIGVKAMSLRRIALEQRRQRSTSSPKITSAAERENEHLSSLFQLMKEDPSWIVNA